MAFIKLDHVDIKGIACAVPKHEHRTHDYEKIPVSERELFIKTTGIEARRVAPAHLSTGDMFFEAAGRLMEKLGWSTDSIDAILVVTQSPDYFIPATAVILQNRLGLKKSCLAFDVNLGCSGYVYGLYLAGTMLRKDGIKRILFCAGDKSSYSTCEEDKSSYLLFGDAGSATAIEFSESASTMYYNLMSDGGGWNAINIPDGGSRNGINEGTFALKEVSPGIRRAGRHVHLNGADIFNFALKEVHINVHELFQFSEKKPEDTDYFVFHQANKLINESIRKKLKLITPDKFPYSISLFGNTSSASIPLTIITNSLKMEERKKLAMCLCGFGVGLSWGSCLWQMNETVLLPLIELE